MAPPMLGRRQAARRGWDRVERLQPAVPHGEAHPLRAVLGAARLVPGGVALIGERDLVPTLTLDPQAGARLGGVRPDVLLAQEEERPAAADAGRGPRAADQDAQVLRRPVRRHGDRLEALAA